MANEFCNLAMKSPNSEPFPPKDAIHRMITFNAEYFDPETTIALMELFNFPIPQKFLEEVKKRQRTT